MKMRKSIFGVMLCLVLALSACSSKDEPKEEPQGTENIGQTDSAEDEEKEQKEKKYQAKLDAVSPSAYREANGLALEEGAYISVIGKTNGTAFWDEVKKGAEQAAEDLNEALGYEGSAKVKVTYNGPSEAENIDEQVNILDEELARYPVAVAIAIADAKACEVQFDLAAENNIPVVAFDSGSDYKGLMAMVSTDNEKSAKEAAQHMAEAVGAGGEVVVLSHDSKSKTASVREQVFAGTMKSEYPDTPVAGIYRQDEMRKIISDEVNKGAYRLDGGEPSETELPEEEWIKEEEITKEQIIDYILKKHPAVKGCYATNGESVVSVVDGLERLNMEGVSVIGYDADADEIEELKAGKIAGTVVQNPFGMGYASVIAASRASLSMANEAYIDTGYLRVTKDNVDSKQVKQMLY